MAKGQSFTFLHLPYKNRHFLGLSTLISGHSDIPLGTEWYNTSMESPDVWLLQSYIDLSMTGLLYSATPVRKCPFYFIQSPTGGLF